MKLEWNEAKRLKTLKERGLDFLDAPLLFAGVWLEIPDDRFDYGEERYIAYGDLRDRPVAMVWTWRDGVRRIISMRHVHDDEAKRRKGALD